MMITLVLIVLAGMLPATDQPASGDDWLRLYDTEWNSRTPVTVTNPHDVKLENIPVIIQIGSLDLGNENAGSRNLHIYDHQSEQTPLFQVDHSPEDDLRELVFLATLEPGQEKTYHVYYTESGQAWPQQKRYTFATDMPGWESERFGYRSYGALALDIFARKDGKYELMLPHFYNSVNDQIFNYHVEHDLGQDILHIGPTAGLAGVGLYRGDETVLLQVPFESEVIASGTVRSIVHMQTEPFESRTGTVTVTRKATIYAHHFETQIEDRISGTAGDVQYAVGIMKEENSSTDFDSRAGLFLQWHNQGDDIGDAGIGVYVNPEDVERLAEDESNRFILVQPPVERPLRFWAFGAWERGENINGPDAFRRRAERIKQLQLPAGVNVGEKQMPDTR
ncbi:MAG: DUF4861 family protein [Balneolaceae bacterium]